MVTKTAEAPPCPLHFVGDCSYLLVALMPVWRGPDAERILVTSSCSVMMSSTLPLTLPPPSSLGLGWPLSLLLAGLECSQSGSFSAVLANFVSA